MADESSATEGDYGRINPILSIGWHLLQGEELSASYAEAAEANKDERLAEFFRLIEDGYRSVRAQGTDRLDKFPSPSWGWRPPW